MHVLALEPYYGGSHRAFLDGWRAHSRHTFTLLELPPYKWKWRMRHAALTFADELRQKPVADAQALWACDMLDLASFRGLAPEPVRKLPSVLYFHENQLTYPVRREDRRDHHFAFINMLSALAADRVWFNSAWHRDCFLEALGTLAGKMPDYRPEDVPERLRGRSAVHPPGIAPDPQATTGRDNGPLHILWAARWEYDKAPEAFFAAIDTLAERGLHFRLSVIGESFNVVPPVFAEARERHASRIVHWGYQPDRASYLHVLREAHLAVSTAQHEFFGIGILEAAAAGTFPLVPRRLAYPETLDSDANPDFFYEDHPDGLTDALAACVARQAAGTLWEGSSERGLACASRYYWPAVADTMDDAIDALAAE